MQISRKHTIISYLIILFVFAADAYSQKAPVTDRPHRHIGDNIQYANPYAIYIDNSAPVSPNWPIVADWGPEVYVTDTTISWYLDPRLAVSDTILHVFGYGILPVDHYRSLDNGGTWQFYSNYLDTSFICPPWYLNVYCENNRLYTVWWGQRNDDFNPFIYFRASSDFGQTWPITAELRLQTPETDARQCNVSGHGDTVFVSFQQDRPILTCWRSTDMGRNWYNPGIIAEQGSSYPPSIAYKGGVASIAYYNTYGNTENIYYINSIDHGLIWNQPQFIGLPQFDAMGQWPELSADDYGNIAVCWMDYYGSPYWWTGGIWVRVSHDYGLTWEEPVRLDDDYLGEVGVTLAIDGDYLGVVWSSSNMTRSSRLHYRESWDRGNNWGQDQIISTGINHGSPRMAKLHDNVHLIWTEREFLDSTRYWDYIKYNKDEGVTGIAENQATSRSRALSCYPNPFNSSVSLSVTGYEGGDVKIKIYDIRGCFVKGIDRFDKEGKTTWDAKNSAGRKVASGIYFARTETPQGKTNIKLLYLR